LRSTEWEIVPWQEDQSNEKRSSNRLCKHSLFPLQSGKGCAKPAIRDAIGLPQRAIQPKRAIHPKNGAIGNPMEAGRSKSEFGPGVPPVRGSIRLFVRPLQDFGWRYRPLAPRHAYVTRVLSEVPTVLNFQVFTLIMAVQRFTIKLSVESVFPKLTTVFHALVCRPIPQFPRAYVSRESKYSYPAVVEIPYLKMAPNRAIAFPDLR
jgi:hypothetical protein